MRFFTRGPSYRLGILVLGIWLILTGLSFFVPLGSIGVILAILAIAAGVLLLWGR